LNRDNDRFNRAVLIQLPGAIPIARSLDREPRDAAERERPVWGHTRDRLVATRGLSGLVVIGRGRQRPPSAMFRGTVSNGSIRASDSSV
jgi:hypothetical protein